jgi:hypothetical protein
MSHRPLQGCAAALIVGLVGCSPATWNSNDSGDPKGDGALPEARADDISLPLIVTPANQTIFIDTSTPGTPAKQSYTAKIGGKDVTATAAFTVDPTTIGGFAGAVFTSVPTLPTGQLGVTATVRATGDGKQGVAKLTIVQLRKTPDTTGKRDFYFVSPYKKSPTPPRDVLRFSTDIQKVDVAIVMDTTASMTSAIANLKSSLSTQIIPTLSKIIPSVAVAVVDFRDWGDLWVVNVRQTVTTVITAAQAAVNAMAAAGGNDVPEAQLAAMHYTLTGQANGAIPAHTPAPTTFGGVDFRPGAVPVVVLVSDSTWHDPSGVVTMASVKTAFSTTHARFTSIYTSTLALAQQNDLSDTTGSAIAPSAFGGKCGAGQCCTLASGAGKAPDGPGGMCRLNFTTSFNGTGVSDSVVTAIQVIGVGSTYDIKAELSNDPTNPGGVDATTLVQAVRAMDEGDTGNGCPPHDTYDSDGDGVKDTFKEVTVGTPICFEVIPKMNTTIAPTDVAQFFNAFIRMIGNPGSVDLGDQRTIIFLIPPKDPAIA